MHSANVRAAASAVDNRDTSLSIARNNPVRSVVVFPLCIIPIQSRLHHHMLQSPLPHPPVASLTSTMSHLLNLSEQDRQTVINNLLLMGMSGSECSDGNTPQINAIGLDFALSLIDPTPMPSPLSLALTVTPVDEPPPHPPCSPCCPPSPKIVSPPLPVVEDDNMLKVLRSPGLFCTFRGS
ncbi:hypothetical protein EDB86DRAFT_3077466 [Lactarius hatsudake]|nr:hypothetical protein EDB86DRAFT_3077466 [Lactarius hatsudake]